MQRFNFTPDNTPCNNSSIFLRSKVILFGLFRKKFFITSIAIPFCQNQIPYVVYITSTILIILNYIFRPFDVKQIKRAKKRLQKVLNKSQNSFFFVETFFLRKNALCKKNMDWKIVVSLGIINKTINVLDFDIKTWRIPNEYFMMIGIFFKREEMKRKKKVAWKSRNKMMGDWGGKILKQTLKKMSSIIILVT